MKHGNLFDLDCGFMNIGDYGLQFLQNIKSLKLYNCKFITNEGLRYLNYTKTLCLANCINIKNKGVKYLQNKKN